MSEAAARYRKQTIERALHGAGRSSGDARRAAFDNRGVGEPARALVDTVARNAWEVTDEDVAAVKAAGLPEDEIFELAVCAALGQATRQLEAALAALEEAEAEAEAGEAAARAGGAA
jgi:hypothetical protein